MIIVITQVQPPPLCTRAHRTWHACAQVATSTKGSDRPGVGRVTRTARQTCGLHCLRVEERRLFSILVVARRFGLGRMLCGGSLDDSGVTCLL